ncbi:glycerate kinase [Streptococcus uberis]|uniref:glycerate kinase family protein n=1 Tax=Streptococcus uberis TaxID=1349 RepID=UPI0027DDAE55|nr:glycerate kinase [Streptococcus uberis]MCK1193059.1 glycerate kinase [Streptococcus uberis]
MHFTIAIDSFKGSATSSQLNAAVEAGILAVMSEARVTKVAIADGGEGTIAALAENLDGEFVSVETLDLLKRPIMAKYLKVGDMAFIESAEVVGLDKIVPTSETYRQATSYGLGALILDAIDRNCQKIYLTLGGTGTSDGGYGLLESLNFSLTGDSLQLPSHVELIGLTDVTNPYYGLQGYAAVFGAQKGGSPQDIADSDAWARSFAKMVSTQRRLDLQTIPGTGAAGGLGAAIRILGGRLEAGFPSIADLIGLEEQIKVSDIVITGEGQLDMQSKSGKVPVGVTRMAQKHGKPVIALCGSISPKFTNTSDYFTAVFAIQRQVLTLAAAMETERTLDNVKKVMENIVALLNINKNSV